MAEIVVTHQFERIKAMLKGIANTKQIQKATARAIKRTGVTVRGVAIREFRSKKMIKLDRKQLTNKVRLYSVIGGNIAVENQYARIWISGKRQSMRLFYPKTTIVGSKRKSISVNQYATPYFTQASRAFQVQDDGVFRKGGKGIVSTAAREAGVIFARIAGAPRLPLEKVRGPSLARLATENGIVDRMVQKVEERYKIEFKGALDFFVRGAIRRATTKK